MDKNIDSAEPIDLTAERRKVGFDVFGPIVEWYLYRLDNHLQVAAERDAAVWFVARAGVRLHELYQQYLRTRGLPGALDRSSVLWTSRILLCKALATSQPDVVNNQIRLNYHGRDVGQVLTGLMRHEPGLAAKLDWTDPGMKAEVGAIDVSDPGNTLSKRNARLLEGYFQSYSEMWKSNAAANGLVPGRPLFLVDSGWQGTTHLLMERLHPTVSVESLFFGAMPLDDDAVLPASVRGLILQGGDYQPDRPETALVFYRHAVEALLEANVESAESLVEVNNRVVCPQAADDIPNSERGLDAAYVGVRDYLASDVRLPAEMSRRFEAASSRLRDMIVAPDADILAVLSAGQRSSDFGKSSGVGVTIAAVSRHSGDSVERRIEQSLWPQAQALVELGAEKATATQQAITSSYTAVDYFSEWQTTTGAVGGGSGRVLVCTRTKNRPLLLERAAASVAGQTYDNYEWVVVNDGGSVSAVEDVLNRCEVSPGQITLVSNQASVGMEAASNLGVRAAESDYVVIHDDDDSWDPNFLESMISFLESPLGRNYGGAISGVVRVDESIENGQVEIVTTSPYNEWLRQVDLRQMLSDNTFPPIAFVYKRALYEKLGGYDESLPVLGDWDFNIRFLQVADIGVVSSPLAYYHHRLPGVDAFYSNSVVGGRDLHSEYRTILLNRYLRGSLGSGFADLVMQAQTHRALRHELTGHQSAPAAGGNGTNQLDVAEHARLWLAFQWLVEQSTTLPTSLDDVRSDSVSAQLESVYRAILDDEEFIGRATCPRWFDEAFYLATNPDVSDAVAAEGFSSGFEHFLRHGQDEGRAPRRR